MPSEEEMLARLKDLEKKMLAGLKEIVTDLDDLDGKSIRLCEEEIAKNRVKELLKTEEKPRLLIRSVIPFWDVAHGDYDFPLWRRAYPVHSPVIPSSITVGSAPYGLEACVGADFFYNGGVAESHRELTKAVQIELTKAVQRTDISYGSTELNNIFFNLLPMWHDFGFLTKTKGDSYCFNEKFRPYILDFWKFREYFPKKGVRKTR
jgi:hypothetical protein